MNIGESGVWLVAIAMTVLIGWLVIDYIVSLARRRR